MIRYRGVHLPFCPTRLHENTCESARSTQCDTFTSDSISIPTPCPCPCPARPESPDARFSRDGVLGSRANGVEPPSSSSSSSIENLASVVAPLAAAAFLSTAAASFCFWPPLSVSDSPAAVEPPLALEKA